MVDHGAVLDPPNKEPSPSSSPVSAGTICFIHHVQQHGHSHRHPVFRLLEVPCMGRGIKPGVDLVHPREGVQDDQVLLCPGKEFGSDTVTGGDVEVTRSSPGTVPAGSS